MTFDIFVCLLPFPPPPHSHKRPSSEIHVLLERNRSLRLEPIENASQEIT